MSVPRAVLAAAAVLLLAGCSASGSGAGATADAAVAASQSCEVVRGELDGLRTDVQGVTDKVPGDIPGAIVGVKSAGERVVRLSEAVTDPTVRSAVERVATAMGDLEPALQQVAQDPVGSAPAAISAVREVGSSVSALSDLCGS